MLKQEEVVMVADNLLVRLVIALLQMLIGIGLSIGAVYVSLRIFDRLTHNLDEWKEMKKGNVAIGILLAGIILSIGIIIESGVSGITKVAIPGLTINYMLTAFVIGVINLVISLLAAVFAVFVAIKILDMITLDLHEIEELKKGNVAVAIMMAAVLVTVSFVIRGAVVGIIEIINALEILKLLGV